jgi:carbon-monoxide dehydrogenase small subunit
VSSETGRARHAIRVTVNGTERVETVEARLLLVDLLRERLDLRGTHIGCDTSNCGCCTVLLDGAAVKSCTMLAVQADGRNVTTIEALAAGGRLGPVQQAFTDLHALQCGFCTPGMVMAATNLLARNPDPSEDEIRHGIAGNLCRCTGYQFIVEAVAEAARRMRGEAPRDPNSAGPSTTADGHPDNPAGHGSSGGGT